MGGGFDDGDEEVGSMPRKDFKPYDAALPCGAGVPRYIKSPPEVIPKSSRGSVRKVVPKSSQSRPLLFWKSSRVLLVFFFCRAFRALLAVLWAPAYVFLPERY